MYRSLFTAAAVLAALLPAHADAAVRLTSGLAVTPGQPTTATFTVVNDGSSSITVPVLVAGNRDASNANRDFPGATNTALAPGATYTYRSSRSLTPGRYTAWPAYFDGTAWHELSARITYDVSGCSGGPFSAANWPGACWKRYSGPDSPFYQPVPANPEVAPNSAAVIDYLLGGMPRQSSPGTVQIVADEAGNNGEPTYYSRSNDPLFTIHCRGSEFHTGTCPIEGHTVRIPAGAQREGGKEACTYGQRADTVAIEHACTSDRHMTIIDQGVQYPGARWEYDLWRVQTVTSGGTERLIAGGLPSSGGTLNIAWGGRVDMNATGLADPAGSMTPPPGDGTAAGWGDLAGRLTAEDLTGSAPINHALFLTVQCVNKQIAWPARKKARACSSMAGGSDTNAPATGAWLRLNLPSATIDALPIATWKKKLLHALADYGGYVGDTGTSQWLAFETESGNQYQLPRGQDPWWTLASANAWKPYTTQLGDGTYEPNVRQLIGQLDNRNGVDPGIDWKRDVWSHLQVLKPRR